LTVRSIWHAGFTVSDIERSVAFYRDAIGLRLRHRQEQANEYTSTFVGYPDAHLRVAQFELSDGGSPRSGHVLELVEYVHPKGGTVPPGTNAVGNVHLAFEVSELDAIVQRAVAAGATPVSTPQRITAGINEGGRTVYLRDPDGITIELVEAPA
jgi:lactoylglutathione lyase